MGKVKMVYYLKEETIFEDGTRRSWSEAVYESCAEAFKSVLEDINENNDKEDAVWSIDFGKSGHSTFVIRGDGKFLDYKSEFYETEPGERIYTIKEIAYREAKKK